MVIRMLTDMIMYRHNIKEEVRLYKVKLRKLYREPRVKGRKSGFKSMTWTRRKK